jgi:four helix bundle protein
MYGLTGQMRRCCASIPTNLAEGCGRGSDAGFARFVQMAMGSASELEYHCLLARDLALIDGDRYEPLAHTVTEIKRMLTMLLKRLRTDR